MTVQLPKELSVTTGIITTDGLLEQCLKLTLSRLVSVTDFVYPL